MLGQVIHGYRVDRVLSADKGGFGEVFLATHVDSGAEAVVKVLRAEMSANRETVTRFFNEARAAASIHHPGIVQIHNVGYHGDRAYLLMERLRGDDLETRLKAGRLPLDRALLFMRQTAGAIEAAHERGIVHRDLKPANLFIVRDPDVAGGERVRVLDFGIAKLGADARADGATTGVFGTPMYMSPEQCASTGAVDHRSDLYSLGCIFYELVCGYPPFGRGGVELIAAHLRDVPTPPRDLVAGLPPAVDALVLSLLEKAPDRRMQSCAALVNALDGAAASAGIALGTGRSYPPPVTAPHIAELRSAETRTVGIQKKGRTGVIVIGAVVIAAGATVAIVLASRGGDTPAKTAAPAAPIDARAVASAPPDARPAEPPDAGQNARAKALLDEGKALLFGNPPDYPGAANKFRQSIVLESGAQAYFDLALAEYSQGDFGNALIALSGADAAQPDERTARNIEGLRNKVVEQMRLQGIPLSSSVERGLVKVPPAPPPPPFADDPDPKKRAVALNDQGWSLLFDVGDAKDALAFFERAIAADPQARSYYGAALAQAQLEDFDAALVAAKHVLTMTPDEALAKKTRTLIQGIEYQIKVQVSVRPATAPPKPVAHHDTGPGSAAPPPSPPSPPPPDDPAARARADAAREKGKDAMYASPPRFDEALADFRESIAASPTAASYVDVAIVELQLGHFGEALVAARKVSGLRPTAQEAAKAKSIIELVKNEVKRQGNQPP